MRIHTMVASTTACLLVGCATMGAQRGVLENGAGDSAVGLFQVAMSSRAEPQARRTAAQALAKSDAAEPWIILVLTAGFRTRDAEGRFFKPLSLEHYAQKHRTYVAIVLYNLPEEPSDAVLWAVTTKLYDRGLAHWGKTGPSDTIPGAIAHYSVASEPIRELARQVLKRALKADHGYDVEAWRNEIMKR